MFVLVQYKQSIQWKKLFAPKACRLDVPSRDWCHLKRHAWGPALWTYSQLFVHNGPSIHTSAGVSMLAGESLHLSTTAGKSGVEGTPT